MRKKARPPRVNHALLPSVQSISTNEILSEIAANKPGGNQGAKKTDTLPVELNKEDEFMVYCARGFDRLKVKIGEKNIGNALAQHLWDYANEPADGWAGGNTRSS